MTLMQENRRAEARKKQKTQTYLFEKTLPLAHGGKIRVQYQACLYPDIHKIRMTAVPYPAIRECTPVTKWYLQNRNERYRRKYGPYIEYQQEDHRLVLKGESALRTDGKEEMSTLKKAIDRKLSQDYPKILDIYFGIVPPSVRAELYAEMSQYEQELSSAN